MAVQLTSLPNSSGCTVKTGRLLVNNNIGQRKQLKFVSIKKLKICLMTDQCSRTGKDSNKQFTYIRTHCCTLTLSYTYLLKIPLNYKCPLRQSPNPLTKGVPSTLHST